MNDQNYEQQLKKTAEELPVETVIQMRKTFKEMFEAHNIPYDAKHLEAMQIGLHLVLPTLPQMYSHLTTSMILGLYKLRDECETGNEISPIQKPKK